MLVLKFVILPIGRIVYDIIRYAMIFGFIADNMVMKSGLPGKIGMHFSYFIGTSPFVPANDAGNIFVDHWIFFTRKSPCFF